MSPRYRHRKSRPFHTFRYGWDHFQQHRDGIRHRHSGSRPTAPTPRRRSSYRGVPKIVLLREFRVQLLRGALVACGLVLVWALGFGAWDILSAKGDVNDARVAASQIINNRDRLLTSAGRQSAASALATMKSAAYAADQRLEGSAPLTVLSWIPLIGNQVNGLRNAVSDVDATATVGQHLLAAASKAADASRGTYIDLPSLKALTRQVHDARLALHGRIRSTRGLYGPIHSARATINREVRTLNALLADAEQSLTFAQPFLGSEGPRTYFVAGLNNSEMRDQGMVLSWAILSVNNGHFSMSHAATVGTISLRKPAVAITEAGTRKVFGPLEPTRIWQSVNAVGSFPTSARWMEAMYAAARGQHVDGVLGIDVVTLQNILRVTGSVRIPTVKSVINSANVAQLVLHDLYVKYPAGSQQQGRRDEISSIAQAAVDKMKSGNFDTAQLLKALAQSTPGRHLLFFDNNARNESHVVHFGASGGLTDHGTNVFHTSVQAGVAAKLDWYVRSSVRYDIQVAADGTAFITTTVTMRNLAPANAKPSYAFGPDNTNTHTAGEYIARVYQWMPHDATSAAAVKDEGLMLTHTVVHLLPQRSDVAVFQSVVKNAVKNGVLKFEFIPQGTIHPTHMTVTLRSNMALDGPGLVTWSGGKSRTITWRASR